MKPRASLAVNVDSFNATHDDPYPEILAEEGATRQAV